MDEEAWVPAVYLKNLGFAAGRSPMGLRRWSGMSMRLREETRDFQEVQNNEVPPYGSSCKYSIILGSLFRVPFLA